MKKTVKKKAVLKPPTIEQRLDKLEAAMGLAFSLLNLLSSTTVDELDDLRKRISRVKNAKR